MSGFQKINGGESCEPPKRNWITFRKWAMKYHARCGCPSQNFQCEHGEGLDECNESGCDGICRCPACKDRDHCFLPRKFSEVFLGEG